LLERQRETPDGPSGRFRRSYMGSLLKKANRSPSQFKPLSVFVQHIEKVDLFL